MNNQQQMQIVINHLTRLIQLLREQNKNLSEQNKNLSEQNEVLTRLVDELEKRFDPQ